MILLMEGIDVRFVILATLAVALVLVLGKSSVAEPAKVVYGKSNTAAIVDSQGNVVHRFQALSKAGLESLLAAHRSRSISPGCTCDGCCCERCDCGIAKRPPLFKVTEQVEIRGRPIGYTFQTQRPFIQIQAGQPACRQ